LFRNALHLYGEDLLAPRLTPKLEDRHLSDLRDCLFNIFTAIFHRYITIKTDLQEIGWEGADWIDLAQDRDKSWDFVTTEMNFRFARNAVTL
jgi:hypothetical protein